MLPYQWTGDLLDWIELDYSAIFDAMEDALENLYYFELYLDQAINQGYFCAEHANTTVVVFLAFMLYSKLLNRSENNFYYQYLLRKRRRSVSHGHESLSQQSEEKVNLCPDEIYLPSFRDYVVKFHPAKQLDLEKDV